MRQLLDNIRWHSLAGARAGFTGGKRAPGREARQDVIRLVALC
jgi:hypothetical protein